MRYHPLTLQMAQTREVVATYSKGAVASRVTLVFYGLNRQSGIRFTLTPRQESPGKNRYVAKRGEAPSVSQSRQRFPLASRLSGESYFSWHNCWNCQN